MAAAIKATTVSKLLVDPGVRFVLIAGRETYGAGWDASDADMRRDLLQKSRMSVVRQRQGEPTSGEAPDFELRVPADASLQAREAGCEPS